MSTEQNTPVELDGNNLSEDFARDLLGQGTQAPASAEAEPEETPEVELDASNTNDEVTQDDEDDTPQEQETDQAPKPKKKTAQERINELVGKQREAERKLEEAQKRIEELTAKSTAATKEQVGPTPDDKNEDGTEKYPLGEFDANYIRDLTRFEYSRAKEEAEIEQKLAAEKAKVQEIEDAQQADVQAAWNEELQSAQERYPDFMEVAQDFVSTIEKVIPEDFGAYLSEVIKQMDNGTEVLYYLANNQEEAGDILAAGPVKATLSLGAISKRLNKASPEAEVVNPTKAPPPPKYNKGTAGATGKVRPDTDDLTKFAREFFKK